MRDEPCGNVSNIFSIVRFRACDHVRQWQRSPLGGERLRRFSAERRSIISGS